MAIEDVTGKVTGGKRASVMGRRQTDETQDAAVDATDPARGKAGEGESLALLEYGAITQDAAINQRAELNQGAISLYADEMTNYGGWGLFPRVIVYDDGFKVWLAGGFQRMAAYKLATDRGDLLGLNGMPGLVPAVVRKGTREDAILWALGDNATHGAQLTAKDRRRKVETCFLSLGYANRVDSWIAKICAVDPKTVGNIRAELVEAGKIEHITERQTPSGVTIRVENIGKNKPSQPEPEPQPADPSQPNPFPTDWQPAGSQGSGGIPSGGGVPSGGSVKGPRKAPELPNADMAMLKAAIFALMGDAVNLVSLNGIKAPDVQSYLEANGYTAASGPILWAIQAVRADMVSKGPQPAAPAPSNYVPAQPPQGTPGSRLGYAEYLTQLETLGGPINLALALIMRGVHTGNPDHLHFLIDQVAQTLAGERYIDFVWACGAVDSPGPYPGGKDPAAGK
jgi:hypothetical protein